MRVQLTLSEVLEYLVERGFMTKSQRWKIIDTVLWGEEE